MGDGSEREALAIDGRPRAEKWLVEHLLDATENDDFIGSGAAEKRTKLMG